MKIYVGADHNGYELKAELEDFLKRSGYEVEDAGDLKQDPEDDFPQFASRAVNKLRADDDKESRAVLICGSGQGMCMAANRFKGIRACLPPNQSEARLARNDDDANVLCMSANNLQTNEAQAILTAFLHTPFAAAPRYKRRIQQLDELG